MNLFEAVNPELFSVLASPNKTIYAHALDVLYDAYRDNLKIPETTFYAMLRSRMEQQLSETTFEDEDIYEEELRDISGKTRFLIRKLQSKGWFEKARGKDFEEYIIVPGYSSMLVELFRKLTDVTPMRGYSYVFGTYSTLKVADESGTAFDQMSAVYSAYDNTQALIKMLKTVYHNVKRYFQLQIEMGDINRVLASHYDDFGHQVIEAYIRPLKIKDSVPKYRVPIQRVLDSWLANSDLLLAMSNMALQDGRAESLDRCSSDLLEKIFWIKERYESLETDYLDEIDEQVRRYTRATTQKIENFTNREQNTRGNLNYLLTALSRNRRAGELLERISPAICLYEQSFLSEKSLWNRKRPVKRARCEPIAIESEPMSDATRDEAEGIFRSRFGKADLRTYMENVFGDNSACYSKDIPLEDDYEYIMSLLALLSSGERDSFFHALLLDGHFQRGVYAIPQAKFVRKEQK